MLIPPSSQSSNVNLPSTSRNSANYNVLVPELQLEPRTKWDLNDP